MTITLDGQSELPLHPLDLTAEPTGQSNSQYCTGLIQTNPSGLAANSDIGDMVLGVPFMRNVYTVMAYEQPDATGNFNNSFQFGTHPMLGLLGLTNAIQAMEEFDHVRVLKQPLGDGSSQQSSSPQGDTSQLSVGVKILIGLVGFFALSLVFFALRCFFARKRWRGHPPVKKVEDGSGQGMEYGAYQRTRSSSRSSADQSTLVHHSFPHKDKYAHEDDYSSEFGVKKSKLGYSAAELEICDPWDPHAGTWRDTIIGTEAGEAVSPHSSYIRPPDLADLGSAYASPELTDALLMAHDRDDSLTSDPAELGMSSVGMAGIGTAARGSIIDAEFQLARRSCDSATPLRQTVSSLRSSHTLTSSRESVGAPYNNADRTF